MKDRLSKEYVSLNPLNLRDYRFSDVLRTYASVIDLKETDNEEQRNETIEGKYPLPKREHGVKYYQAPDDFNFW